MPESLLSVLKWCALALLYLFFLRVLRAVWAEINAPRTATADGGAAAPAAPGTRGGRRAARSARKTPSSLRVVAPPEHEGRTFPLGDELTVGRAAGCQVTLDDGYVSQLHARVFTRDAQVFVEDLGSTNGTYLNRHKVDGPTPIRVGDQLQVGKTVLEAS